MTLTEIFLAATAVSCAFGWLMAIWETREVMRLAQLNHQRERFAMAAMQGLCANPDFQLLCEHLPVMAISQAEALIAALKSTPEPE
jgi:hypothetical protein